MVCYEEMSEFVDQNSRNVLIYTHTILSGSMTFIKSHADALSDYRPIYCGAHRAKGGLALPNSEIHVVNNGSLIGMARELAFRRWGMAGPLVERLRGKDPALVHVHFGTSGPSGLALAERLHIPALITFHGADATISEQQAATSRRGRELLRGKMRMIERAGRFIAVSNYIRDRLLEQDYPADKIVVHRNGINLDFFQAQDREVREPAILFVGRFVEKKGVHVLLDAAARLKHSGLSFRLVLIGEGPMGEEIREAARAADIDCEFTGFLPLDQVRDWIGRVAVVAVPSMIASDGDSEGLPTILLEAQAMKTPVVSTFHSGIPEGVRDGVTAELVPEGDAEALAEKLRSFLDSPEKVREFGLAGRNFVSEHFCLKQQVRGLEAIYTELADHYAAQRNRGTLRPVS